MVLRHSLARYTKHAMLVSCILWPVQYQEQHRFHYKSTISMVVQVYL